MKPQQIILDEQDKLEIVAQIPDKTQKLLHSIKPQKGHTLFEINPLTGKCKRAEYETIDVKYSEAVKGDMAVNNKVIATKNCIYISALNKKNALIKFFKMVGRQIDKTK